MIKLFFAFTVLTFAIAPSAFSDTKFHGDRKPSSVSDKCFETAERIAMTIFQEGYGYGGTPNAKQLSTEGDFAFSFSMGGSKIGETYKMSFNMDQRSEACTLRSLTVQ